MWVAIQHAAGPLACIARQARHSAGSSTIRHRERHDTTLEAHDTAPCSTILCTIRRATALSTTQGHDTAGPGLRHDQARPATRRNVCVGWARVCTWCTQPNFDSVHCFQSLFEPLFMNTVHKIFQKNNFNKIK